MVVELVQVVVLVVEALGAKLLANDIVRKTRVQHEIQLLRQLLLDRNSLILIDSKTRLPKRDYSQQQDPQQDTGEGWP